MNVIDYLRKSQDSKQEKITIGKEGAKILIEKITNLSKDHAYLEFTLETLLDYSNNAEEDTSLNLHKDDVKHILNFIDDEKFKVNNALKAGNFKALRNNSFYNVDLDIIIELEEFTFKELFEQISILSGLRISKKINVFTSHLIYKHEIAPKQNK